MRNLKTIEKKVRAVLEKNEDARNDDMVLYLALCNACLKDAGAMPLAEIMTQHKYLGLPSCVKSGKVSCDGNYVCCIDKTNSWYRQQILKSVKDIFLLGH